MNVTPERMRALANRITSRQGVAVLDMGNAAAALRAAADQLEAVRELHFWLRNNIGSPALHSRLDRFNSETTQEGPRG